MNGDDTRQEDDTVIARLYRAGNDAEPAEHLDAAILAAAKREAGAGPRPLAPFGGQRWMTLSTAAVILVAFGLVTLVAEREPASLEEQLAIEKDTSSAPAGAEQKQLARKIIGGKAEELALRREREIRQQVPAPVSEQAAAPAQPAADSPHERADAASLEATPDTAAAMANAQSGRPQDRAKAAAERSDVARDAITAAGSSTAATAETPATVQDWLKRIDKLIAEGRLDAARRELKALQEKFPDFTLEKKYKEVLGNK